MVADTIIILKHSLDVDKLLFMNWVLEKAKLFLFA